MAEKSSEKGCAGTVGAGIFVVIVVFIAMMASQHHSSNNGNGDEYIPHPESKITFTSTIPSALFQLDDSKRLFRIRKACLVNNGEGTSSEIFLKLRFNEIGGSNQFIPLDDAGTIRSSASWPDEDEDISIDVSQVPGFPRHSADVNISAVFEDSNGAYGYKRGEVSWHHRFDVTDWMHEEDRPNYTLVWHWIVWVASGGSLMVASLVTMRLVKQRPAPWYKVIGWLIVGTLGICLVWIVCAAGMQGGRSLTMGLAMGLNMVPGLTPHKWCYVLGTWGAITAMALGSLRSYFRLGSQMFRTIAVFLLLLSLVPVIVASVAVVKSCYQQGFSR